jgi:chromosome segregation ATPase
LQLQLAQALANREDQGEQQAAEHRAALASLEASLAQAHEERDEARLTLSELRPRLAQAVAEHDAQRQQIATEHRAAVGTLERSLSLAREERDLATQTLSEVRAQLAQAVKEHELQREQISTEHRAAIGTLERSLSLAREERDLATQTLSEVRAQLAQEAAEHEVQRDQIIAEHRAALSPLEESLARSAEERTQARHALSDVRAKLSQALAEQSRLAVLVDEHERERARIVAEHERTVAELEAGKREALAEAERTLTEIKEALLAGDGLVGEVERRLTDAIEEAAHEDATGDFVTSVKTDLGLAVSRMRLQTLMGTEASQARGPEKGVASHDETDATLQDEIPGHGRVLKAFADQRSELRRWQEAAIQLEPLAAAGRLAIDLARDLQETLGHVDARTRFLLTLCSSEGIPRSAIETLRADALRAASLARQFTSPTVREPQLPLAADADDVRSADDGSRDSRRS